MSIRLIAAAALAVATPAAAVTYTVTPLDAPGSPTISPQGLGPDGTVVGQTNGTLLPVVRRPDGTVVVLPTLGGPRGGANAINAAGTIVGGSRTGALVGSNRPFVRAVDGTTTTIALPTGADLGAARGIAATGMVAGDFRTSAGYRVFSWTATDGLTVLGVPGGGDRDTFFRAISAGGVVVGISYDRGPGPDEIVRWSTAAVATVIGRGTDADPFLTLGGIDGDGTIVGGSEFGGEANVTHATVWNAAGVATDVGVLPGDQTSELTAIARGVAVGTSSQEDAFGQITSTRLVRWTAATGLQPLTIAGSFAVPFDRAVAINDAGQVLASGRQGDTAIGAILDVAGVPEPATWLTMLVGLACTGAALRRRVAMA